MSVSACFPTSQIKSGAGSTRNPSWRTLGKACYINNSKLSPLFNEEANFFMYYLIRAQFDGAPLGETLRSPDASLTATTTVTSIWGIFARVSPMTVAPQVLPYAGLKAFRAVMRTVQSSPGPLFRHGDPGGSLFILECGTLEIRASAGGQKNHVRLTAFAEGSIFGKLLLLMNEPRTANAVWTAPARLLELDRATMEDLETNSPQLFGAILRNLSLHIARRVDASSGLVRSLH